MGLDPCPNAAGVSGLKTEQNKYCLLLLYTHEAHCALFCSRHLVPLACKFSFANDRKFIVQLLYEIGDSNPSL